MKRLGFDTALGLLLLIALVLRVAYVLAQLASDPAATGALLDGAYYVNWGHALAEGTEGPGGAYYLAPLYAWLLGGFFTVFGDNIAWLYLLQQVLLVSSAGLLGLSARRLAGDTAGLASIVVLLLYHPALFFASRPLGEPVALFLLALAVWLLMRPSPAAWAAAGVAVALSALARPNLLLVIAVWGVLGLVSTLYESGIRGDTDGVRKRRTCLALALVGVALVLVPIGVRNWRVSGHFVPVSANAGMTLYHGNAPGAWGIGVATAGFSGKLSSQREEATRLASLRAGRPLDDVEADRWWGRQALHARAADPSGTLLLLARRTGLLLSNTELGLDYAPSLDRNPWRRVAPLPYALLLALAVSGLCLAGFRRSGGWIVWGAILACAATPLLFYVSSRYRLPTAVLLALPAGVGLAELWRARGRRLAAALALVLVVVLVSFALPARRAARTLDAASLANRAVTWKQLGDLERAEQDFRQALVTDPDSVLAHFGLAKLLEDRGEIVTAERHYRRALELLPAFVDAAQNLGGLLTYDGRPQEAVPVLLRALELRSDHAGCWQNLVVAHYAMGQVQAAHEATARAAEWGVVLNPDWLKRIERSVRGAPETRSPAPSVLKEDPSR